MKGGVDTKRRGRTLSKTAGPREPQSSELAAQAPGLGKELERCRTPGAGPLHDAPSKERTEMTGRQVLASPWTVGREDSLTELHPLPSLLSI